MESNDKPHGVGDIGEASATDSLFAEHADINEDPEHKTWSDLIEGLDVERADAGVQLASNEPLQKGFSAQGSR